MPDWPPLAPRVTARTRTPMITSHRMHLAGAAAFLLLTGLTAPVSATEPDAASDQPPAIAEEGSAEIPGAAQKEERRRAESMAKRATSHPERLNR